MQLSRVRPCRQRDRTGVVGAAPEDECFPVLVACGIALERAPRTIAAILLAASATAMAGVAIVITTHGLTP
jgi:hypothetical protein